jgi:Na+/H+ antiporter NhaC
LTDLCLIFKSGNRGGDLQKSCGEFIHCSFIILGFISLLFSIPSSVCARDNQSIDLSVPGLWVKGPKASLSLRVRGINPSEVVYYQVFIDGDGPVQAGELKGLGEHELKRMSFKSTGRHTIMVRAGDLSSEKGVRVIHGVLTLLPPLLAIFLALAFRQVLAALWLAIWLGAFIVYDWHPFAAIARSIDHYLLNALSDPDDAAMLLFIIFMGGLIGIISKSGGIQGIVEVLARRATSTSRAQLATWAMGLFIFFDDFANTLIVGNAMRPITDKLKISREKLSYIVDTTAAPIASVSPISTWIGYEVGLINGALASISLPASGYILFIQSIPFRFYPVLALFMVFLVSILGRDLGPMLRAERRARREGKVLRDDAVPLASLDPEIIHPPEGAPRRWCNAVVPLLVMIVVTFVGLWVHGIHVLGPEGYKEVLAESAEAGWLGGRVYILGMVLSNASANTVLCWASLTSCLVAVMMVVFQRILSLGQSMHAWLNGVKSMVIAIVVLLFAWSLGSVCADLHTAEYVTHAVSGLLSPHLLPVIVFLIACGISFATGTSYGTMAILIPLAIPIAHRLSELGALGAGESHTILVGTISSVLAGAVFGDHCSPISDTTIMSSMASSADHVDHVRTQLPYALLVACIGMLLGDIPTAYGMSPWITWVLGILIIVIVLVLFGRKVDSKPVLEQNDIKQ